MYINGGENITIRNSKFRDCAIYDIFATISGPDAARIGHRNLMIENNWFDTPWTEDRSGGDRARASGVSLAWCQNSPRATATCSSASTRSSATRGSSSTAIRRAAGRTFAWSAICCRIRATATRASRMPTTSGRRPSRTRPMFDPTDRVIGDKLPVCRAEKRSRLQLPAEGEADGRRRPRPLVGARRMSARRHRPETPFGEALRRGLGRALARLTAARARARPRCETSRSARSAGGRTECAGERA